DKENRSLKDDKRKRHLKDDLEKRTQNVEIYFNKVKEKMLKERDNSSYDLSRDAFRGCQLLTHLVEAAWYDDLSSDEKRIVFKDKSGSSSTSLSSKHLASRTHSNSNPYQAKLRSSSKDVQANVGARAVSLNLLVPTKRPHPVWNCALGLAVVKTWAQILNKEFGIKNPKKMLEQVHMLLGKGKGRWCRTNLYL
ncbi:hypothetical protein Tco_1434207, partial [Tanacetum coccineum]